MTTRLKELFQSPWIFVLACGMNGEGTNIVEEAGYGAFYMSEGNTSARPWQGGGSSKCWVDNEPTKASTSAALASTASTTFQSSTAACQIAR